MHKELIGACGIYCRACDHYFANTDEGKHLLDADKGRIKAHPCKGCKAEDESQICIFCVKCDVRLCSMEKGYALCTECNDYPCAKLTRFVTGLEHHKHAVTTLSDNKHIKPSQWEDISEKRWSCSHCGAPYSYYEVLCNACGKKTYGLSPDLR